MQEVGLPLYFNVSFLSEFVEPAQPDVAPRSDVVIPDGKFDWTRYWVAHLAPFIDGLGEVGTSGHTVFSFTAPMKLAPSICDRLKFVR